MTEPVNRQTRKRLATRQRISDIATRLFVERGFDATTIDEIAEAADVSRMTVFNHFARKEDLFFDLDDEGRADLLAALEGRPSGASPLDALAHFPHWAIAEHRPYARFFAEGSGHFVRTIRASESLKARARAIRDELSETLASALARAVGRPRPDPAATLAATLTIATWGVALVESHRVFEEEHTVESADRAFLALVDRGIRGVRVALEGTPYV